MVRKHFEEQALDVFMFYGVHGRTFGLRTVIPYEEDHSGSGYCITPGHVGLVLSHWCLWNVLQHLPGDEFLVFEDDVNLVPDFKNRFADAYSKLPMDWQFVFVGHVGVPNNPRTINDSIQQVSWAFGTHAYLVKRSALPTLLHTNRIVWSNIDIQLARRSLPHLHTYAFAPSLAGQHSADLTWPHSTG